MPHFAAFFVPEPGSASPTPREINASLFYQLAQFVVWGEQHSELVASHPDLAALLQTAAIALTQGGIPEQPGGLAPPAGRATKTVEDSQSLASAAVSEGKQ
jgi:hypothetical protein